MWKPIEEWDAMKSSERSKLMREKVLMFYFAGDKHPTRPYLDKDPVVSDSRVFGSRTCTHFLVLDHPE